jgi:hypothetical protein
MNMRGVGLLFLFLFLSSISFADNSGIPHYGVRYTLKDTDIYSPLSPKHKIGVLPAHTAVLPCVIIKDGVPFLGFNEIFREPVADIPETSQLSNVLEAAYTFQTKREAELTNLRKIEKEYQDKKVQSMDCVDQVDGIIPLRALFAKRLEVKYTPVSPQSLPFTNTDSTPRGLLKEFHNSVYCASAELKLGSRKKNLIHHWDLFINEKLKKNPKLKESLRRAKNIDFAARTALYEANPEGGCSEKSQCEKDLIMLTIKNRSDLPSFGSLYPGDVVGVSTIENQYSIWSETIADMTYITSCFLREDLENAPADYQKVARMYEQSIGRAEKILYDDLSTVFNTQGKTDAKDLRHYYHPGAMEVCYPQFDNLKTIPEAYANYHGKYFPVKDEFVFVYKTNDPNKFTFKVLKKNNNGTIDPIDDVITFESQYGDATLPLEMIKPYVLPPRCSPYGINPKCNAQNPVYYRTYADWLNLGYVPEISCRDVETSGKSCDMSVNVVSDVTVSGPCNRSFSPIAGIK